MPPYGIFTSGPTARICTETPNLEETFYFLVCVHKLVNGTPEGTATRGALGFGPLVAAALRGPMIRIYL